MERPKKYKIDGFRFDIMSFTFVKNLEDIRKALARLTLERDGIDGSKIYHLWRRVQLRRNGQQRARRERPAVQPLRHGPRDRSMIVFATAYAEAVPFDDERVQGFATGLLTDPSIYTTSIAEHIRRRPACHAATPDGLDQDRSHRETCATTPSTDATGAIPSPARSSTIRDSPPATLRPRSKP